MSGETSIETIVGREVTQAVNAFIIPPPGGTTKDYSTNPIYQNGSDLTIRWLTNYTSYCLRYNQDLPDGGNGYTILSNLTPANTSYQWKVNSGQFNLSQSSVYWFQLRNEDNSDMNIDGHYINITLPSTTSSMPSTTTPTAMPTAASPLVNDASTTASATIIEVTTSGSLSSGAAAGIGIGSAMAAIALLTGLFFLYRWRRRMQAGPVAVASHYSATGSNVSIGPCEISNEMDISSISELPVHEQMAFFTPTDLEQGGGPGAHVYEMPCNPASPSTPNSASSHNIYDASPTKSTVV